MQSELLSLSKIFTENLFRIPDYQRGYSWTERQLKDFWNDLVILDSGRDHYTGVLTLELVSDEQYQRWSDDLWIIQSKRYAPYYVVDGQQRLTTALILIQAIIDKSGPDSELNYSEIKDIRKKFLFESRDKGISRSYIFGYEKDNPSYEFLKTKVFMEQSDSHSIGEETIYTQNLTFAKEFFAKQLENLSKDNLEEVYTKLTQHFLFNIYTIAGDIDVFVAFETMNNRGKLLSYLELLKNRLIFLSTRLDSEIDERVKIRSVVNESWKTAYHYLGKNRKKPLDDDYFLYVQFLLYFGPKFFKDTTVDDPRVIWRTKREEFYKTYLLDEVFTTRNLQRKGATPEAESIQENDSESTQDESQALTAESLYDYAHDIKRCVQLFYSIYSPEDSTFFNEEQKVLLIRLNRLGWLDSIPLVMAVIGRRPPKGVLSELLELLDRVLFIRALRSYMPSGIDLVTAAIHIKAGNKSVASVIEELNSMAARSVESHVLTGEWIRERGFYSWRAIRYFLFEYEQDLKKKARAKRDKIAWDDFVSEDYEHDYFTVEHVYPQKPDDPYWKTHFKGITPKQRRTLQNSLGNLVALSRAKNSSLSNRSFSQKRDGFDGNSGFRAGSYSEIEVSRNENWTPTEILERGILMLSFMEKRWQVIVGDRSAKARALGLDFLSLAVDRVNTK